MTDELAYTIHGVVTTLSIIILVIVFSFITPFNLNEFLISIVQLPIYLILRGKFNEPIHAKGLIKCYALTILFFILIFVDIKLSLLLGIDRLSVFVLSILLTSVSCYFTSTLPDKRDNLGKLFFGYVQDGDSKYQPLIDFIKYESATDKYKEYLEAEEDLKSKVSTKTYLIYKRKFIDNKKFKEISNEFDIDNRNIVHELDKGYFFIIGKLGL